jgi:hypothetical protein
MPRSTLTTTLRHGLVLEELGASWCHTIRYYSTMYYAALRGGSEEDTIPRDGVGVGAESRSRIRRSVGFSMLGVVCAGLRYNGV